MRMSTDESRDEELALETIAAAAEAGITVFDTARAYGRDAAELGHNERLLARGLRRSGADVSARIVTKGGMTRAGGGWIPDGRAKVDSRRLRGEPRCPGRPRDRPLPHPRTRSADAVANLRARVGPTRRRRRREARGARECQPPPAGRGARARPDHGCPGRAQPLRRQRAPGRGASTAAPSLGITVIAHSPLGGPRRAGGLARHQALADVADACGATPAEVALAWLLELSPAVVRDPRRSASGDGALRRPRCDARSRRRRPSGPRRRVRRASSGSLRAAASRRTTRTWSSSWASQERGRAVSRRSTSPVATSASTATSAEDPCESSPTHSTRSCRQAFGGSSSTTRTSLARHGAT